MKNKELLTFMVITQHIGTISQGAEREREGCCVRGTSLSRGMEKRSCGVMFWSYKKVAVAGVERPRVCGEPD